jgi:hypothetical protein
MNVAGFFPSSGVARALAACGMASLVLWPITIGPASAAQTTSTIDLIDRAPKALFDGLQFAPGQTVTIRAQPVGGTVMPYRRVQMERSCRVKKPFSSSCWIGGDESPIVKDEVRAGIGQLGVLLRPTLYSAPLEALQPKVGPSNYVREDKRGDPQFQGIVLSTESTSVTFQLPGAQGAGEFELTASLKLDGIVLDTLFDGRQTRRNRCEGLVPGECGQGQYELSIVAVDASARRAAVISMLQRGQQRLTHSRIDQLVDPWLRNRIVGGRVEPDKESRVELAGAIMDHIREFYREAALRAQREPILRLAIDLDPNSVSARSALVADLVASGRFTEGRQELQKSLPEARAKYALATADKSKPLQSDVVAAFADMQLLAGGISRGQYAATALSDVQASLSAIEEARNAYELLLSWNVVEWRDKEGRAPKDAQGQPLDPVAARRDAELRLVEVLRQYASVSQLIRSDAALDKAVDAIRRARSFYPRTHPGELIALSTDARTILVGRSPRLSLPDADPALKLDVVRTLVPSGVEAVVASHGDRKLVRLTDARWGLWTDTGVASSIAVLDASAVFGAGTAARLVAADLRGPRATIVSEGPDGRRRFFAWPVGQKLNPAEHERLARAMTMSQDGSKLVWVGSDGHIVVEQIGESPSTSAAVSASAAVEIAFVEGTSAVYLLDTERNRLWKYDPSQAEATPQEIALPGLTGENPLQHSRLVVWPDAVSILGATRTCFVQATGEASCSASTVERLSERLVRSGPWIWGDKDRQSLVAILRRTDKLPNQVLILAKGKTDPELRDLSGPDLSPAAFLEQVTTATGGNQAIAFERSFAQITGEILDMSSFSLVKSVSMPDFDGRAVLTDKQQVLVAASGRTSWGELGSAVTGVGPSVENSYLLSQDGLRWLEVSKNERGAITGASLIEQTGSSWSPPRAVALGGDPAFVLRTASARDHSALVAQVTLVAADSRPSASPQLRRAVVIGSKGVAVEVNLPLRDPRALVAAFSRGDQWYSVEHDPNSGLVLRSGPLPNETTVLLAPDRISPSDGIEVFQSTTRLVLRHLPSLSAGQAGTTGMLIHLDISLPAGSVTSAVAHEPLPLPVEGLIAHAASGQARRAGFAPARAGFVDVGSGVYVIPGDGCALATVLPPIAKAESIRLPALLPTTGHVVASREQATAFVHGTARLLGGDLTRPDPTKVSRCTNGSRVQG